MKQHIVSTIFFMLSALTALPITSQILVKSNGDTIKIDPKNPLKRMTPNINFSEGANHITFTLQNGASGTYHIALLDKLLFAYSEATAIGEIKANKQVIIYNAETDKVYVSNAKKESSLMIYNLEGKCIRSIKGCELSLIGLPAGLYIVSYNNTLNAKILKK